MEMTAPEAYAQAALHMALGRCWHAGNAIGYASHWGGWEIEKVRIQIFAQTFDYRIDEMTIAEQIIALLLMSEYVK